MRLDPQVQLGLAQKLGVTLSAGAAKGDVGIIGEQLGLIFEPTKAAVDVVVIDAVQMPTPN